MSKKIININDLSFDNRNLNLGSERGNALLHKSLQEVGAGRSVLADKNGILIAGNKTIEAFGQLGLSKIKVVETTGDEIVVVQRTDLDINTAEGVKMKILDNSVQKLNYVEDAEISEAICEEYDLKPYDYGLESEKEKDIEDDEFEMPEEIQTSIVLGDLFEIGPHFLLCGDSTNSEDVARLMDGKKADLVFTDPPYLIETRGAGILQKEFRKTAERIKDIVDFKPEEWLQTLPIYFNGYMNAFIFCNKELIPDYLNFAKENRFNFNILVWCKKSIVPFTSGHHYSDIEYIIYLSKNAIFNNGLSNTEYRKYFILDNEKNQDHPTIKPIKIASNEILIASNSGGIVADCFLGSGTTMVAAHQLNRICYGMEISPQYVSVILRRMKKLDNTLEIRCLNRNFDIQKELNNG